MLADLFFTGYDGYDKVTETEREREIQRRARTHGRHLSRSFPYPRRSGSTLGEHDFSVSDLFAAAARDDKPEIVAARARKCDEKPRARETAVGVYYRLSFYFARARERT